MATEKHKTTFDQLWVDLAEDVIPGLPVALLQTGNNLEKVGYAEQYEKERNSSMLDMINLIYVAFTRPAERLYILTREPAKAESANLPSLLNQFIQNSLTEWIQNENVFSRGIDDVVMKPDNETLEQGLLSEMISSPWQGRIKIARRAPVYWSTDASKNKQAWGTLIHDTIADLRTGDDIITVASAQAKANLLSEEETALLQQRVSETINHELLKDYFIENVDFKPESGILTPDGSVYRPDRVVFSENKTVIMEFKTGIPEPVIHRKQLDNYGNLLEQMGYTGITKLLVYIDETVKVEPL